MQIDTAIARLRAFATDKALFAPADPLLLAISGGMDSMCMLHLLLTAGQPVEVAHVNYRLRAEDSDLDAALVHNHCDELGITCHTLTESLAPNPGESVQVAARRVRYHWISDLLSKGQYKAVCTAHHLDDSIETFFINLVRGTGVDGLKGIPPRRDHIVRPMLCFTRKEIELIVSRYSVPFRHDKSNQEDYYLRNQIRNKLLPVLESIQPHYRSRMLKNMLRIESQSRVLESALGQTTAKLLHHLDDMLSIDLEQLEATPAPELVLQEIAGPYGFTETHCSDLLKHRHQPGKKYLSQTHQMTVDRGRILISAKTDWSGTAVMILTEGSIQLEYGSLSMTSVKDPVISTDPNIELVDADCCTSQFQIRPWRPGDRFHPLGAPGKQKVQDFLTNMKVPLPVKQRTLVLLCDAKIVWVVGHRLDDRFKITAATKNAWRLKWQPGTSQGDL